MRPAESFIAQPIRSLQTMLRVIAEATGTIPTVVPDGIYGSATIAAVTEFQKSHFLPITGITDQTTWEAIVKEYEPALVLVEAAVPLEIILDQNQIFDIGDQGPYVYLVQSLLIWLAQDYDTISPPQHTGTYDQTTKNAVAEFQKLSGLPTNGQLDKITWKNLSLQYTLNAHHNSARQIHSTQN